MTSGPAADQQSPRCRGLAVDRSTTCWCFPRRTGLQSARPEAQQLGGTITRIELNPRGRHPIGHALAIQGINVRHVSSRRWRTLRAFLRQRRPRYASLDNARPACSIRPPDHRGYFLSLTRHAWRRSRHASHVGAAGRGRRDPAVRSTTKAGAAASVTGIGRALLLAGDVRAIHLACGRRRHRAALQHSRTVLFILAPRAT